MGKRVEDETEFARLARLTARLASTARLDEIVDTVLDEIVDLGFGAVWMAGLDEPTGNLRTLKEVIDGVDTTHEMPEIFMLDMRQPIGHGFQEGRMINIPDPDALYILERGDEEVPPGRLALPRVIYQHMRGHPFACGPLLGSRRQPVGAIGLSSYRGQQQIPDEVLTHGMLRAFMDHLGIAMERASNLTKLERLNGNLLKAQTTISRDAQLKAVGELAAAVAHDLNNLSGVALMAISIGERSEASALEVLPRIARANRAIGSLVARLQRVAYAGIHNQNDGIANVREIVEDVVVLVGPVLREHAVVLELKLSTTGTARSDPTLIHQLVLNLILNALDALREHDVGHRHLRIRLTDDEDIVRLVVADSGPGIGSNVLPQIFQPFVTTKPGHAGLGLSAAHAALKHFGGTITCRNASTGGAVFEVTLTRTDRATLPVTKASNLQPRPTSRRTAKILVVDDDEDIVAVICAFLEPLGHEVVTACDADQALVIAATRAFDLILCDIGMPKRNGLDVCQALQETGFQGKIALMTGWEIQHIRSDPRAVGCARILSKPFFGEDLIREIDALLPG
jgi:signal transduction histidine kinase